MANTRNLPDFNDSIMVDIEDAINQFLRSLEHDESVLKTRFEFTATTLTILITLESN